MPLMLAPLPSGQTVTVHRRTRSGSDGYGNPTWTVVDEVVEGYAWWPGAAGRNVAGSRDYGGESFRSTVTTRGQVIFPDGTAITSDDEVTLPDGHRYRVSGEGQQWTSHLTGATTGIQVGVERTDG